VAPVVEEQLRAAVTADGREEAASPQAPAKSVSATDEEPTSGSPANSAPIRPPPAGGDAGPRSARQC
jgi:hypothetical protein